MRRLIIILVCVLQTIAAVQIYSHLPLHSETYVRHLSGRVKRSIRKTNLYPSIFSVPKSRDVFAREKSNLANDSGTRLKDILLGLQQSTAGLTGPEVKVIVPPGVPVIDFPDNRQEAEFKFPKQMRFAFTVDGERIVLDLQLNEEQHTHTRVDVMEDGHIVPYHETGVRDYAYYHMLHHGLGVSVKVRCEHFKPPCYIVGRFTYGGEEYAIEKATHQPELLNKDLLHNIHKVPSTGNDENTDDTLKAVLDDDVTPDDSGAAVREAGREAGRDKRAGQIRYRVELMMVTDCWIYKYWLGRLGDEAEVMKQITEYYGQVAASMDVRYSTATTASMAIDIIPVEILIIKDCQDSPWTNTPKSVVIASDALSKFQTWVYSQEIGPNVDAIQTYTRKDLSSSSTTSTSITGLARMFWKSTGKTVSILCKASKMALSIIEDNDFSGLERTGAHELGHNMGGMHDGIIDSDYPSYSCSNTDKFVMSSSSGASVGADIAANPWTFSRCSIAELQRTLSENYYDSSVPRCLSESSAYDEAVYKKLLAAPRLGELFSVNDQCVLRQGIGSVACTSTSNYPISKICYNGLPCSSTTRSCSNVRIIRAFAGSACAPGKWCHKGQCVTKPATTTTKVSAKTTTTTTAPVATTTRTPSPCETLAATYAAIYEAQYEQIYECWDVTCVGTCGDTVQISCKDWFQRPGCT